MIISAHIVHGIIAIEKAAIPYPVVERIVTGYVNARIGDVVEGASVDLYLGIVPVMPAADANAQSTEYAIGDFDIQCRKTPAFTVVPSFSPVNADALQPGSFIGLPGYAADLEIGRSV